MNSAGKWIAAAWLLCAVFAAIAGATFLDYGVTWDEGVQSRYGALVVDYFTSSFRDSSCNRFLDLRFYGPLFEMIPAAAAKICPYGMYEVRHAAIAGTALLSLIGIVQFGRKFANPAIAFFAVLALLTTPYFYGHAFNNSKDIPFACGFVWSMERIAALMLSGDRTRTRAAIAGVVIGLTMAIRIEAVLLLVIFAAALVYRGGAVKPRVVSYAIAGGVSWLTMVAFWPWAHENPILNPLRALLHTVGFPANYPLLFEGRIVWSHDLPRRYLVELLAITTPIAILLLALAGIVIAIREIVTSRVETPDSPPLRGVGGSFVAVAPQDRLRPDEGPMDDVMTPHPVPVPAAAGTEEMTGADASLSFLVLVWFFLPLVLFFIRKPHVYDGIRHFLFMLPAVAVLAAMGAAAIVRAARRVGVAAVTVSMLLVVPSMVALHPYQMTFYNALVGGVGAASQKFETDYWASSYREGLLWINDHPCDPERPPRILVAGNSYVAMWVPEYAPPGAGVRFVFTREVPPVLPTEFDYFLATTRYGFAETFAQTPVVRIVGRRGAVFSVIRGGCGRDARDARDAHTGPIPSEARDPVR